MCVLEHYFASKSFAALHEALSNVYPDKEVPNKTICRLVTKFRDTGNVYDRKHIRHRTVLTGVSLRNVEGTLARSPQKCLRRLSQQSGITYLWQVLIERQNSWNYGRTDFKQCISCNNGIRLQEFNIAIGFVVLCVKGFMCSSWDWVLIGTFCRTLRTKLHQYFIIFIRLQFKINLKFNVNGYKIFIAKRKG
jgi:hypothetical protein